MKPILRRSNTAEDDAGKLQEVMVDYERLGDREPFDQAGLEDFIARSERAFARWWEERKSSGTWVGIELDDTTAQMIWQTVYEDQSAVIGLVLDSARGHSGGHATVAELRLGYVVDRFHGGSITFPTKAFIDWLAQHEDDYSVYLDESEQVQIRIKSRCDEPIPDEPIYRLSPVRPTSPESVRAHALKSFLQWWESLDPPGSYNGRSLDADEARAVWFAACVQLWEELEAIHEVARAHADVQSETAHQELAYLVDSHHHGKLTLDLDDLIDWSMPHERNIRRNRNKDTIAIWLERTV